MAYGFATEALVSLTGFEKLVSNVLITKCSRGSEKVRIPAFQYHIKKKPYRDRADEQTNHIFTF